MIKGLHHNAYRCRDSEETRRFYEGFLGLRVHLERPPPVALRQVPVPQLGAGVAGIQEVAHRPRFHAHGPFQIQARVQLVPLKNCSQWRIYLR